MSDSQQQNQSDLTITIKNDATIIVQENEMTVDYESPKAATNNLSLLNDSVSKKPPCIPDMSKMSLNDNKFKNLQSTLILNKKKKKP